MKRPATWFLNGFHRFLRPFLKRHFHSIAIDRDSRLTEEFDDDVPLIVYANHPSWWDPLIAHFLCREFFPQRDFFAPIDEQALQQYSVFEKLGFYGVNLSGASGAGSFLKKSTSILNQRCASIWMTPQGRFVDPRDDTAELMPGLSHLCCRSKNVVALPLALEYVFWDDRLPVCLTSLGTPLRAEDHPTWSKPDWAKHLDDGLRNAQSRLSELSIRRSCEPFDNVLSGARGGGWVYDTFRRAKAVVTGRSFRAGHGDQFK